jgi:hypothetical protein
MSSKTKIIAFSVAALLAVGGGIYAFMPSEPEIASGAGQLIGSGQTGVKPEVTDSPISASGQSTEKAGIQATAPAAAPQPAAQAQPAVQAPKKLTKEQLMPPPATEDEKLQKAAEQESNF